MPTSRVASLAMLLALSAVQSPTATGRAANGGTPRLRLLVLGTVAGGEHLQKRARLWDEQLLGALARRADVELLEDSRLVEQTWQRQPEAVEQALAQARQLWREGRQALLQLELERAVEELASARILLRRHIEWLADPALLVDVLMALGEALEASGQRDAARDAYLEVLALVPGYVPDPGQLPSRCQQLFEQAGEALQGNGARLELSSSPSPARVYLDGMSLGQTPLEADDLPPGMHGLVVWREGFMPHRQRLSLQEGETTSLQVRLEDHPAVAECSQVRDAIARAAGPEELLAAMRRLGRHLQVQRVIVSYLGGSPRGRQWLATALVDVSGARQLVLATDLAAGSAAGERLLERLLGALGDLRGEPPRLAGVDFDEALLGRLVRLALPPPAPQPLPPPEPAPAAAPGWWQRLVKNPWFWTAVAAAGATALTTGLVLGLRSTETVQDPDRLVITLERVTP